VNPNDINRKLGPCGLLCEKCFAYSKGPIRKSSIELQGALGHFDVYADRFKELLHETRFALYKEFKDMLNYFSEVECRSCRLDACKIFPSCKVAGCAAYKNVDCCFQCDSFPCDNTGHDEHLKKRWFDIRMRMKESGIKNYYNEIKDKPRY